MCIWQADFLSCQAPPFAHFTLPSLSLHQRVTVAVSVNIHYFLCSRHCSWVCAQIISLISQSTLKNKYSQYLRFADEDTKSQSRKKEKPPVQLHLLFTEGCCDQRDKKFQLSAPPCPKAQCPPPACFAFGVVHTPAPSSAPGFSVHRIGPSSHFP